MLSKLRVKYWIPKSQTAISIFFFKCQRSDTGKQVMADSPGDILLPDDLPFTNVGINYFVSFKIKGGRILVNRYGVIFTSLTTRAVHIEISSSLDTDACIHVLRRFDSSRALVQTMRYHCLQSVCSGFSTPQLHCTMAVFGNGKYE